MKAAIYKNYGPPDVVSLAELPVPEIRPGDLLIRVQAATVSSSDSAFRRGAPFIIRLFAGLRQPRQLVLGTEFAGEIASVGKSVEHFRVGEQVFAASGDAFGAHAEFIRLAENAAVAKIPDGLSHAEAAALAEGCLTALPFLRDLARLQRGQSILINGAAGAVGCAAVQLARLLGAEVSAVCGSSHAQLMQTLGADHVIDYTQQDFTRSGKRYDVVFDAVGKSSFPRCRACLKPGGLYMTTVLSAGILLQMLLSLPPRGKRARIIFTGMRPPTERARDLSYIAELAEAGELRPVIDRVFPLAEVAAAHRLVDSGHKTGSAVLDLS